MKQRRRLEFEGRITLILLNQIWSSAENIEKHGKLGSKFLW